MGTVVKCPNCGASAFEYRADPDTGERQKICQYCDSMIADASSPVGTAVVARVAVGGCYPNTCGGATGSLYYGNGGAGGSTGGSLYGGYGGAGGGRSYAGGYIWFAGGGGDIHKHGE